MPLSFDATLKDIVHRHTADFEAVFRLTGPAPGAVVNVDLSTITAASDVVIGYGRPPVALVDLNFQAGRDRHLADRVLLYNALLRHRYHVPVHSFVVLLRRAADDRTLTGRLRYRAVPRRGKMDFSFEVARLWQVPVRRLLSGGVGTLPLALLGQTPAGVRPRIALADVVQRLVRRVERETEPADADQLLTASLVLAGLRMSDDAAVALFRQVRTMEESTTYRWIMKQGEIRGLRRVLLRLGREKLGPPDEATTTAINGLTDLSRLDRMTERVLTVSTWQELLATR
jgi:predicted transposase YdaD